MRAVLALLGMGFSGAGVLLFMVAPAALQQIVAVALMIVGAVLFAGAAVVDRQIVHDKKFTELHEELIAIRRAIERGGK